MSGVYGQQRYNWIAPVPVTNNMYVQMWLRLCLPLCLSLRWLPWENGWPINGITSSIHSWLTNFDIQTIQPLCGCGQKVSIWFSGWSARPNQSNNNAISVIWFVLLSFGLRRTLCGQNYLLIHAVNVLQWLLVDLIKSNMQMERYYAKL